MDVPCPDDCRSILAFQRSGVEGALELIRLGRGGVCERSEACVEAYKWKSWDGEDEEDKVGRNEDESSIGLS